MNMRGGLWVSTVVAIALSSNPGFAGPRTLQVDPSASAVSASVAAVSAPASPRFEKYRGYSFDLSESSERKDVGSTADMIRRQLDIVESAGFSPRVLQFFHTVPIVASEMACLDENAAVACYGNSAPQRDRHALRGVTVWDNETHRWTNPDPVELAADSGIGVIMLRPIMTGYDKDPVLLHEFLHAYHAKLMPNGFDNKGIKDFYGEAQNKNLFPKEAYVLKNNREFFAVTATIFLAGKDSAHEPFTRAKLKEQMPGYFKYLVGVFGFDPDASAVTPVASAD
jgi:hypothetical protein